jgi:hypothetical protein
LKVSSGFFTKSLLVLKLTKVELRVIKVGNRSILYTSLEANKSNY